MKKYSVNYTSGATGYGWQEDLDTITEVEYCIQEYKDIYTAQVSVFDRELGDYVFCKNALAHEYNTDFIFTNRNRDLRTSTRLVKS